jgi:hypothetical protein
MAAVRPEPWLRALITNNNYSLLQVTHKNFLDRSFSFSFHHWMHAAVARLFIL